MKVWVLRALLPLLLLAAGVWLSRALSSRAPSAERRAFDKPVAVVELLTLQPSRVQAKVQATGLVTPAQQVRLLPQVTGEVVFVSESLVPGGLVRRGQVLAKIDARDYQLALEQQRGTVRSAELEVERETAQQELAKHEWELIGGETAPTALSSRQSQRATALANLAAGESGVKRAQLNLSRTSVVAPFDATVISESVDLGQVVGPQSELAHLIGTGELWVMVSTRVEDLALLQIPGISGKQGSPATVTQRLANQQVITREGRVTRLVNQLDEQTRRAQLVVSIPQALSTEQGLPLLPGAYVHVEIAGNDWEQVFTLPRTALYEGDVVWVAEDGKLAKRQLTLAWSDQDAVYASAGLRAGEQLVLTRLSNPLTGMAVKAIETPTASGPVAQETPPAPAITEPGAPAGSKPAPRVESN